MIDLDLKDRKLLYELDCNSRQTVQQLARKIGLSKDAVKYRINRLLKDGIIKSFNAVIDTGKLGFISFRFFLKFYQLSPEKEKEILDFLQKNKNLVWFVQAEGNWDIFGKNYSPDIIILLKKENLESIQMLLILAEHIF